MHDRNENFRHHARRPRDFRSLYSGRDQGSRPEHDDDFYYGGMHAQRMDWPSRYFDSNEFDRREGMYQAGGRDFDERMHENERGLDAEWYGYGRDPGNHLSFESRQDPWGPFPEHHGPGMWKKMKNFFGIGPKGYKRSDERIREDVCEALALHPEVDASDIEVMVKEGQVTLKGTVESRWMKRRAEDALAHVSGVEDVRVELGIAKNRGESFDQPENRSQMQ